MATYHIDIYNGNDANDGSTWALAKKNIPTPQASNDIYKFCKTPDPIGTGVNATWTKGNAIVTTASPLTKSIEQCVGSTWVVSPSVTASTYATQRKLGATCQQFTIAAAFTTGKIAYKTLAAPIDLSSFSQLSLWANNSSLVAANISQYRICLCSDSIGNVIVNSLPLTEFYDINVMQAMVLDNGAPLGINIASIAIYGYVDTTTQVQVRLSNIFACNDILNIHSLIGISTEKINSLWYSPQSIVDNTIIVDCGTRAVETTNYVEDTVTTELITRKAFQVKVAATTDYYIVLSNTVSYEFELSFGWNPITDIQDSLTWFDAVCHKGTLISKPSNPNYFIIKNIGLTRGEAINYGGGSYICGENIQVINCYGITQGVFVTAAQLTNKKMTYVNNILISHCFKLTNSVALVLGCQKSNNVRIKCCNAGATSGLYLVINSNHGEHDYIHVSENNYYEAIQMPSHMGNTPVAYNTIRNAKVTNTGTLALKVLGNFNVFIDFESETNILVSGENYFRYSKKTYLYPLTGGIGNYGHHQYRAVTDSIYSMGYNKWYGTIVYFNPDVKRLLTSTGAWVYSSSNASPEEQLQSMGTLKLGEIYAMAGEETTVAIWLYRDSAVNSTVKIIMRKDINDINDNIIIDVPITATDWQQFNIVFTPLITGIFTIEIKLNKSFGEASGSAAWVDSIYKI
jgi:hypothetical protein